MWERKKRLLALLCLPALALVFLLFFQRDCQMPSYKGRSLSYWAKQLARSPNPSKEREEAMIAIRAVHPADIPLLIGWIGYDYDARYARMKKAFRNLPPILRNPLIRATMDGVLKDPQHRRADIADVVLPIILNESSSEATAGLVQLSNLINSTNAAISDGAFDIASSLSINGLAILLPIVADENHPRRLEALLALDRMPYLVRYASNAAPVLIRCTYSQNSRIAKQAADTLYILQNASINIPILIPLVSDPDPQVRVWAIRALGRCRFNSRAHEAAQSAVPFLVKALQDPILQPREEATNALQELAPEVLANSPAR